MSDYITEILKAVHSVPVKDVAIADYVALRILSLLVQDSYLKRYLGNEVDIPEFMKKNNVVKFERRKNEV